MLKRVNLHIEENHVEEIDSLVKSINDKRQVYSGVVTRADLIRFAISRTLGLGFKYVHISKDDLWSCLRKAKKGLV